MHFFWYRIKQFLRFYLAADTRYQVHSPFVFEFANAVLEDDRWFYAFDDAEAIRRRMLNSDVNLNMNDYGASDDGMTAVQKPIPLRRITRLAASSPAQGRRLFRLAEWLKPERMLELGTSVGIGAMYLAAAAREARLLSLEGSEACTHVARANLGILGLNHRADVIQGAFSDTLPRALQSLGQIDLAFFDGHHRKVPTIAYFEQCLSHVHERSVLVFDDIYWSPEMTAAWEQIKQHPRVTFSIDCYDLAFVFFNPDMKEKQHFRLLPSAWKPWKKW